MLIKIKHYFTQSQYGPQITTTTILILVGINSFLLGRLSKSNLSPGIEIEYPKLQVEQKASVIGSIEPKIGDMTTNTAEIKPTESIQGTKGNFFGSKVGKKYYPVGCSAGKSLKLENRIYFSTAVDAEKAGYTKSSSCR